jgi:TolA-binding protein
MKRAFIFLTIILLWSKQVSIAQDVPITPTPTTSSSTISAPAPDAAAVAAREDAEERAKRTSADIEALQAANEALQTKLTAMEQEIQTLRDAQAHANDNSNVQDALKTLAEKIQEVDKKREEDKATISEEIRKSIGGLEKSLGSGSVSTPSRSSSRTSVNTDAAPVTGGFSYTIHDGDRLWDIVKAYNKDFASKGWKSITSRQVREANPNVDWGRLRVNQKIVIPKPAGE